MKHVALPLYHMDVTTESPHTQAHRDPDNETSVVACTTPTEPSQMLKSFLRAVATGQEKPKRGDTTMDPHDKCRTHSMFSCAPGVHAGGWDGSVEPSLHSASPPRDRLNTHEHVKARDMQT